MITIKVLKSTLKKSSQEGTGPQEPGQGQAPGFLEGARAGGEKRVLGGQSTFSCSSSPKTLRFHSSVNILAHHVFVHQAPF